MERNATNGYRAEPEPPQGTVRIEWSPPYSDGLEGMDAPTDLEFRVLKLAMQRGLISLDAVASVLDGAPTGHGAPVGERIQMLVDTGQMDPDVAQALAVELVQSTMFMPEDAPDEIEEPGFDWLRGHDYIELSLIGLGPWSVIYRARDPRLERYVALKFPMTGHSDEFDRVLADARDQAKLDHPNIAKVFEVGERGGRPCIVMQLIRGCTLWELRERLSLEQKLQVMRMVAHALHAAHQAGMLHLHMTPSDILIEGESYTEPWPYLTDLHSKGNLHWDWTSASQVPAAFVSPECLRGAAESIGARSDVYSLGATLYALLCGFPPFDSTDPHQVLASKPVPLKQRDERLPSDLWLITEKCMRTDPSGRYASAQLVAEELDRVLKGEPLAEQDVSLVSRYWHWIRRKRRNVIIGVSFACAGILACVWTWHANRLSAERIRLAERYSTEIQTTGHLLRMAHMSRIHDIRPTIAEIRQTMNQIQRDMDRLGPNAEGPGAYALGQGWRALDDRETAQTWLDRAWKAGFRTPACARIRGMVLAERYQDALKVLHAQDPQIRQKKIQHLNETLRTPALECLRIAGAGASDAPYLEALSASLQDDPARAIQLAKASSTSSPWLYELDLLECRLHQQLATSCRMNGQAQAAKDHLREAGDSLERAIQVAPSDPALWEEKGWLCFVIAAQPGLGDGEILDLITSGRKCFDTCISVNPDYYDAYGGLARYWRRMAELTAAHGKDPIPELDRAVSMGELAHEKTPKGKVSTHLSWALLDRARAKSHQIQDPTTDLKRAIVDLRAAADRGGDDEVAEGLEESYSILADTVASTGENPLPYFREAAKWAMESSLTGDSSPLKRARALGRQVQLEEAALLGNSPSEVRLSSIIQELELLSAQLPDEVDVQLFLIMAHRAAARENLSGTDSDAEFRICEQLLDREIQRHPTDFTIQQTMAETLLMIGDHLQSHRLSGSIEAYRKGAKAVAICRKLRPKDAYVRDLEKRLNER